MHRKYRIKFTFIITQFTQIIHNIIVRNSVKQYINTFGDHPEFMSPDVYDAAKCFAIDTGVEELYFKTYNDSAMLLKQRQDPAAKVSVCNLNNPEQPKAAREPNPIERKNKERFRSRSVTPEKRASYNNDNRPPVTCYNSQQPGHVSRHCRNKKVFPKSASGHFQSQSKELSKQKQSSNVKQTWFEEEAKNDTSLNNINVRINATVTKPNNESSQTARAQVYEPNCNEIAVNINVNDSTAVAIIEVAATSDCQTSEVEETLEDKDEEIESASIIEEQDFKENYLPEKHFQEIAVNLIAAGKVEGE